MVEEEASRESLEESNGMDSKRQENPSKLHDAIISDADLLMDEVYGDHIHQNSGQHLHGEVKDNTIWQNHWSHLVVYPALTYNAPTGTDGSHFVKKLAEIPEGI
jgi:hypothetical protein